MTIAILMVFSADIHCVYMADEATNGNPQGGETEAGSEPTSPSLEDLQRQLAEMEAEQSELAIRLQQQTDLVEPQLDSHLAVIEEQFRENFDDRLREAAPPASGIGRRLDAAGTGDVLLINRVFREVSRCMGDEWMPVFDALMSSLPQEVIEQAKNSLQQHPPLIQVCLSASSPSSLSYLQRTGRLYNTDCKKSGQQSTKSERYERQ